MRDHPRAVERDLIVLNRVQDELTLSQLASIVLAAPPMSSVRDAVGDGWSNTDHLLANLTEQLAGLIQLTDRYPRPGVVAAAEAEAPPPTPEEIDVQLTQRGGQFDRFDTPADFQKRLAMARGEIPVA